MTNQPAQSYKKRDTTLPYFILFVCPVLLYLKTTHFEFIPSWDDAAYVLQNPYIKGFTADNLKAAFTGVFVSNYAPVHILSYMIDHALWGLKPSGYHMTNLILHALNTVLLFLFMQRITRRSGASFVAALLFAVHPLNVENVAWVSERKTLLTTLFSLLSLVFYDQFRRKGGRKNLIFSLALFVLAILSKPLAVILPLIITAYEIFLTQGAAAKKFKHISIYYFIALAGAAVSVWVHISSKGVGTENLSSKVLFGTVYPTMLTVFWKYISLVIFPFNLSGYYDTAVYSSWLDFEVVIAFAAWLIVFGLVLWKGDGQVKFWFFWFWAWLLPVSNIIPIYVYYADRYMYMPAAGLFLLLAMTLDRLSGGLGTGGKKTSRAIAWSILTLASVYFIFIAHSRLPVWHDEVVFWEDTVQKSPGHAKSHLNLGYAYEIRGRLNDAEQEYLASVKLYPSKDAVSNLKMVRLKIAYLRSRENPPQPR